ncbi:ABC transporter ATP-binding protein [Robinsoniella sp. KNHs210]|uniref:ABC transporter ATP-binding protein n=1 Tax=Robinsoniella sp. KNHs210 TaxID=1469950 RepID=UPI000487B9BA|nr:ABC transporter ATP-binding protein [Robinsoniella sp. KNHs210]
MDENNILSVKDLNVFLKRGKEKIPVVEDMDFQIQKGKTLGIIGESGSGKSVTCSSVLGILDREKWESTGRVLFEGSQMPYQDIKALNRILGKKISWITQNPMSAFDPLFSIEYHFQETVKAHENKEPGEIHENAAEILKRLHIHDPERVLESYSFQLSGGMLQRVMIAIALIQKPALLIADEPTTALDLTVQHDILKLLKEMQEELQMAILLVSHDLGVISKIADDIMVMYAGKNIEHSPRSVILKDPVHPYTKGLFRSRPVFSKERLPVLKGQASGLLNRGKGCMFYDRCPIAGNSCKVKEIPIVMAADKHMVRCLEAIENSEK